MNETKKATFGLGIMVGIGLGILIFGVLSYFLVPEQTAYDMHQESMYESMHEEGGMESMHAGMEQMMVTSERAFIDMMIPHHEEAIDTANEVLERGVTTDEIRALMNAIVSAQTAEVQAMKEWYEVWFSEPYKDTGEYKAMMRDLADLSGEDIDRAFLEDMIPHHMGAIMMARSVQPYIEHDEMTTLTANIVRTQSAEIVQMRNLLAEME